MGRLLPPRHAPLSPPFMGLRLPSEDRQGLPRHGTGPGLPQAPGRREEPQPPQPGAATSPWVADTKAGPEGNRRRERRAPPPRRRPCLSRQDILRPQPPHRLLAVPQPRVQLLQRFLGSLLLLLLLEAQARRRRRPVFLLKLLEELTVPEVHLGRHLTPQQEGRGSGGAAAGQRAEAPPPAGSAGPRRPGPQLPACRGGPGGGGGPRPRAPSALGDAVRAPRRARYAGSCRSAGAQRPQDGPRRLPGQRREPSAALLLRFSFLRARGRGEKQGGGGAVRDSRPAASCPAKESRARRVLPPVFNELG